MLVGGYALSAWLVADSRGRKPWVAHDGDERHHDRPHAEDSPPKRQRAHREPAPLRTLLWRAAGVAAIILVAGFYLTRTGEALAAATGLGASFFGAVVLAIATSLPEISTVVSAARLGRYEMAISDIFGTNLIDVALIAVVDAVYAGPPVLAGAGRFSGFAALIGIAVTVLYVIGLVERRDRTVARMGIDSLAVLLVYVGGVAVLYQLR